MKELCVNLWYWLDHRQNVTAIGWVVDLRHFLTPSGALAQMPAPARRLGAESTSRRRLAGQAASLKCTGIPALAHRPTR